MAKEYKIQKQKTPLRQIADILFKVLVVVAVLIFSYIIYDKADFSSNSLEFKTIKKSEGNMDTPAQLKWFDSFKGIENVPNKNKKKESNENTGFKYEGFKK